MPSTTAVSDPQAPFANLNGLVAALNVDLSQEMVEPDAQATILLPMRR